MTTAQDPIGTPGTPWGDAERALWRSRQSRRRSYADDVLGTIDRLRGRFDAFEYGRPEYAPDGYPLLAIRSRAWHDALPCVLGDRKSTRQKSRTQGRTRMPQSDYNKQTTSQI